MVNIKIRGIYSTALTKLMLDNDFKVVQATDIIRKRFNLKLINEVPDVEIFDNIKERQGVVVIGDERGIKLIKDIFKNRFKDIIIRSSESRWNSICKGKVLKYNSETKSALLEVNGPDGIFQGVLENCECKEGDNLLVCVKFPNFKFIRAKLSQNIVIPGTYAILIEAPNIRISHKITNPARRERLIKISNKIQLYSDKWNILWRTNADLVSDEELEEEIYRLNEILKKILEYSNDNNESVLFKGQPCFYAEFPYLSKIELDNIRSTIIKTVPGHHYTRAMGNEFSLLVDFTETLLERVNIAEDEIKNVFSNFIRSAFLKRGRVNINHVKLDGRIFHLTPGIITNINEDEQKFIITRYFKGGTNRLYDGLNVPIEPGDYGKTEIKLGEFYFKTTYYNKDNKIKGTYYNINTPVELYQNSIRYVDLEVDVIQMPDGKIKIEDKEVLDSCYLEGLINLELKNIALNQVKQIIEKIKS